MASFERRLMPLALWMPAPLPHHPGCARLK